MNALRVATIVLVGACCVYCQDADIHLQKNLDQTTTQNPLEETQKPSNSSGTLVIELSNNISESNPSAFPLISPVILTDIDGKSLTNSTENNSIGFGEQTTIRGENVTSNEFKPFLLFPTLPFLFPGKEAESNNANGESLKPDKTNELKPFLFFKFSVNIHEIPLNNGTDNLNDSKIVNVKRLDSIESPPGENLKKDSENSSRKRRNAQKKRESTGFFDDIPLFSDGNIDEFFPKPDMFFPDLLFHRKPLKKLSRKKRDMKKSSLNNDLKFFMDLFDEAFTKTKRDLEQANPILEFLQGGNEFTDRKTESDPLKDRYLDEHSDKKTHLIKITRENVQNNGGKFSKIPSPMAGDEQSPVFLVDKIVKISEMSLPEAHEEKIKMKNKKKRDAGDTRRRNRRNNNDLFELMTNLIGLENEDGKHREAKHLRGKQEKFKRDLPKNTSKPQLNDSFPLKETQKIHLKALKLSESNTSANETKNQSISAKETENPKETDSGKIPVVHLIQKVVNSTENILNFAGDLIKVMDSLESKFKDKLLEKPDEKRETGVEGTADPGKPISYADIERNITKILKEFMTFFKNLDSVKFDVNDMNSFDWTENETLQNSNNIFGKRSKKNADFTEEYVDKEKKEKQVADLNFLFLTVTLPTIIISALLLLVCFFSLQVRGKICTRLFKPRRVLVVEDETPVLSPVTSPQEPVKTSKEH